MGMAGISSRKKEIFELRKSSRWVAEMSLAAKFFVS
jgi:hypothetical protein